MAQYLSATWSPEEQPAAKAGELTNSGSASAASAATDNPMDLPNARIAVPFHHSAESLLTWVFSFANVAA